MTGVTPYRFIKRLADVLFSLGVLLLLSPIMVLAALAVRFTSKGPALYWAKRVGVKGRVFRMAKFRTMVINADSIGPTITAGDDPRITKVGKILRATKIDELPQFWNVLIGDMSVVGPRPNVEKFAAHYQGEAKRLLDVRQGVTDFASLWFRNQEELHSGSADPEADYEARVAPVKEKLGVYYVEHVTLANDAKILLATIGALLLKISPLWAFPRELVADLQSRSLRTGTEAGP